MTSFSVNGKVALVTGGASGIGLSLVQHFLEKGVKGVTIVDVSKEAGIKALEKLRSMFEPSRILYVQANTSKYSEFENAFRETITTFHNIDILINNAGIVDEVDWQREVDVNLVGTINGIILGLEHYIPKHKSGNEGVIVNTISTAGVEPIPAVPIYCGTKMAVHGLTVSWGHLSHYNRTGVRVVGFAPGATDTNIFPNVSKQVFSPVYLDLLNQEVDSLSRQTPEEVAPHVISIIEKAPPGTVWVVEGGQPGFKFELPSRFSIPKIVLD